MILLHTLLHYYKFLIYFFHLTSIFQFTGELSNDELEELRRAIQSISQSTHPLSKCMDFVHDDVALMNEEAEEWHQMYRAKIGSMESGK